MKVYLVDRIIKDVRVVLDQNMVSDALTSIGDVDTLALNEIIRSKVVEGVKRIHSTAPAYLLDSGYNFGDAIYWKDLEGGWVLLPENFMRLVVFELSDWERPCYAAGGVDEEEYKRQSSRFKGIRGTSQKTKCFIALRPEGRVLEFYSSKTEDTHTTRGVYLPYPYIDVYGGIEICSRCYTAIVYTIAALTLETYGDVNKSSQFVELAKTALI